MADRLHVPVPAGAPASECSPVADLIVFDHVGRNHMLDVEQAVVCPRVNDLLGADGIAELPFAAVVQGGGGGDRNRGGGRKPDFNRAGGLRPGRRHQQRKDKGEGGCKFIGGG